MKRIISVISIILVFCIISPLTVIAEDGIYKDVGYDKWYSRAVHVMKDENVMLGDYFGFRPDDSITRAEFVTILSRLANAATDGYTEAPFDDVPIDAWYGKVIDWAKENGLVDGYSETLFGPDDPITREQMCVILANFIEKYLIVLPEGEEKSFADADTVSDWAVDAVAKCAKWGVVSGMENNMFCPADTATRAHIAQLFYNMLLKAEAESSGIQLPGSGGATEAPPVLHYEYYDSFEDFAQYIMTVSDEEIGSVTFYERQTYSYLDERISDEEFKYGFFGSFIRLMRERETILYPLIDGEEAPMADSQQVTLHPSLIFKKSEVRYNLQNMPAVDLRYLAPELCEQAEENGASWLMRTMDEHAINVHNFEKIKEEMLDEGFDSYKNLTVYEKEYTLADRTVKALVYDRSTDENPTLTVYFVYEDALIRVFGKADQVEEMLPKLSFAQKSLL